MELEDHLFPFPINGKPKLPIGNSLQPIELKVVRELPPNLKRWFLQSGKKTSNFREWAVVVQVPFHILEGDIIKVDTVEGKYLEKVK